MSSRGETKSSDLTPLSGWNFPVSSLQLYRVVALLKINVRWLLSKDSQYVILRGLLVVSAKTLDRSFLRNR